MKGSEQLEGKSFNSPIYVYYVLIFIYHKFSHLILLETFISLIRYNSISAKYIYSHFFYFKNAQDETKESASKLST